MYLLYEVSEDKVNTAATIIFIVDGDANREDNIFIHSPSDGHAANGCA